MPASIRAISLIGLACAGLVLGSPGAARAGAPELVSFRGLLTLDDGRLAPDDLYELEFSIFDAPTGGSLLFTQQLTVPVTHGLYDAHVSTAPDAPLAAGLGGTSRYLEVAIRSGGGVSDLVLAPRQRIASVPYALVAGSAGAIDAPSPGIPDGAIVLWDGAVGCDGAPSSCPCGYQAVGAYDGMTVRGAGAAETPGAVHGAPGTAGTDGDVLTTAELPGHTHDLTEDIGHIHKNTSSRYVATEDWGQYILYDNRRLEPLSGLNTSSAGAHTHVVTANTGGDGPHYHPFRTTLFCRKTGL